MVIAFFVFMESVARLVDPPDIDTNMLTVSFVLLLQRSFAVNNKFMFFSRVIVLQYLKGAFRRAGEEFFARPFSGQGKTEAR